MLSAIESSLLDLRFEAPEIKGVEGLPQDRLLVIDLHGDYFNDFLALELKLGVAQAEPHLTQVRIRLLTPGPEDAPETD